MNRQPFSGAPGLVGMPNDARIEQRRRFERVFVEEVGADQPALRLVQFRMRLERLFHFGGACLENIEQIPVAAFEVLEHLAAVAAPPIRRRAEAPCRRYDWRESCRSD